MKLHEATTKELAAEIAKFQRKQSQANAAGEFAHADDIGNMILAPLFGEMARRQKLNGGESDWRKWGAA